MRIIPALMATEFAYGTIGEKLSLCGQMILSGLGTVFIVLIILWGIISLFGVFSKLGKKKAVPVEVVPANTEPEKSDDADKTAETSDDAVIAAIIAAIEAYRSEEGSTLPYRVVSFKRKTNKKNRTGSDD